MDTVLSVPEHAPVEQMWRQTNTTFSPDCNGYCYRQRTVQKKGKRGKETPGSRRARHQDTSAKAHVRVPQVMERALVPQVRGIRRCHRDRISHSSVSVIS